MYDNFRNTQAHITLEFVYSLRARRLSYIGYIVLCAEICIVILSTAKLNSWWAIVTYLCHNQSEQLGSRTTCLPEWLQWILP